MTEIIWVYDYCLFPYNGLCKYRDELHWFSINSTTDSDNPSYDIHYINAEELASIENIRQIMHDKFGFPMNHGDGFVANWTPINDNTMGVVHEESIDLQLLAKSETKIDTVNRSNISNFYVQRQINVPNDH
jgi:hypothetical protein